MAELSHSQMQKEHYGALKNPLYVLDGMLDILREEVSMELPYPIPLLSEQLSILTPYSDSAEEPKKVTTIYTHINIDKKALELQKRIVSLEEEITKLRANASKPRDVW